MKRFILMLLLAAVLSPIGASPAVLAAETEPKKYAKDSLEDLPGNGDLFAAYVDSLFSGDFAISAYGDYGTGRLEGVNLAAYQIFRQKIRQIAAGETADTRISLSLEDLGITQTEWTAAELGVNAIVVGGRISSEAAESLRKKIAPDLDVVLNYLLLDCPMELYWFDKTAGVAAEGMDYSAEYGGREERLIVASDSVYSFSVASEYGAGRYTVNTSAARAAHAAAENAKAIVAEHAGKPDDQKLEAYRQEICDLVSYNTNAAENAFVPYGNPWQLIWVFDGNPDTNVVCEGYAKAFQHLCDLSTFQNPNVRCHTVTGTMDGGIGAGGHMWNVVTLGDGKNYIVDVTNCDTGSIGADDLLFLAGASGSVASGYTVACNGRNVTYAYSDELLDIYGTILEISPARSCAHRWLPLAVVNAPSCLEEGSRSMRCSACGVETQEAIPKLSHNMARTDAKAASCTTAGNMEYYTCGVCGRMFRDVGGTAEITREDVYITVSHAYESITTRATTSENGSIAEICSTCGSISKTDAIYYPKTIRLAGSSYAYTGKEIRPAVTVLDSRGRRISTSCYTVTYSGNKSVGEATATIRFRGNYSGAVKKTFAVCPPGTKLTSLNASSKAFTVRWSRQASQTSGYQIQYGTNKSFKGAKIRNVSGNKATMAKISGLKAKGKYYVRIRTFKTLRGALYYSSWSSARQVTVK